jgi:hypothetical protein
LLEDLDSAELIDLDEAVAEIISADEIEAAAVLPPVMGTQHVPWAWLQARLLDAEFGAAAGVLYVGELRQVRRYLADPVLRTRVDEIVAGKMAVATGGARILVGHSLGSVVAWEFVRQHPDYELDLLVTLGSPLGLRIVRSRLPEQARTGGVPQQARRWVNVRDLGDPVACAGDLATWWPGVDDRYVDNGRDDVHNVCRYLSKAETGSAIAGAYPGLRASSSPARPESAVITICARTADLPAPGAPACSCTTTSRTRRRGVRACRCWLMTVAGRSQQAIPVL